MQINFFPLFFNSGKMLAMNKLTICTIFQGMWQPVFTPPRIWEDFHDCMIRAKEVKVLLDRATGDDWLVAVCVPEQGMWKQLAYVE